MRECSGPAASALSTTVQQDWKSIGTYGTVGLELAISILVGLAGGRWIDQRLHTEPWFSITGFAFGTAAGVRFVWRALQRANREADRLAEQERQALKELDD